MSLPQEFRISEYDQAIKLLRELERDLENGEILSVLMVAERTDGTLWGGCTATDNVFAVAGYVISWALRRMGFAWELPQMKEGDNV